MNRDMDMTGIRNIIFDFGGVIVDLDKQRCLQAFQKLGLKDIASYVSEHRCEDLFFDMEIGRIGVEEFCQEARRITNSNVSDEQIIWAWNELLGDIAPWKIERLKELKKHYRLFLLSNTNPIHWHKCDKELDGIFEKAFLSYELHLSKPSEEIFREVIKQAGVKPEETIFFDDSTANCEAAAKTGLKAIKADINGPWPDILGG